MHLSIKYASYKQTGLLDSFCNSYRIQS
uniref:Uncharacterized protein n=1 Tax=Anguilla anguilla TaxID=7936 RepID=A0A0E9VSU0_ANGAN